MNLPFGDSSKLDDLWRIWALLLAQHGYLIWQQQCMGWELGQVPLLQGSFKPLVWCSWQDLGMLHAAVSNMS